LSQAEAVRFGLTLRPYDVVVFDHWRALCGQQAFDGEHVLTG